MKNPVSNEQIQETFEKQLADMKQEITNTTEKLTKTTEKLTKTKEKLTNTTAKLTNTIEENKDLHKLVKRKERKQEKDGEHIYILKCNIDDHFKIGWTTNLNKRLYNYISVCPCSGYDYIYTKKLKNAKMYEGMVLHYFDKYRITEEFKGCKKREWFSGVKSENIIKYIESSVLHLCGEEEIEDETYFQKRNNQNPLLVKNALSVNR